MNEDCREDIINSLIMWAAEHGIPPAESKYDLYMILNNVEITSRCTEITEINKNRNEMLLKKFLIAKNVQGCTKRTIEFYGITNKKVLQEIGKTVDDITPDDIRIYMAKRLRVDKVTKTTVANEMRALSSLLGWLYREEIIKKNPMFKIGKIKKEKTKKEALTDMEIEKLRMAAKNEKDTAIIEILLSTGCRVSELVNIKKDEVEAERILVHGKGEKDRYVYLNAKAQLSLEKYLTMRNDQNPYVFPRGVNVTKTDKKGMKKCSYAYWWQNPENIESDGHLDKGSIEATTRRLAKRAGIKQANPHKFRRTCATMALRKGMPIEQVSKMLGHEEISTTQIYLDLTEEELALAHRKYVN